MKCCICLVEKLSKEFPRETITDDCDHPPLYCLRCITEKVKANWKCPYEGCGIDISEDNERLREFEETLDFMFPPVDIIDTEEFDQLQVGNLVDAGQPFVMVTTLTGDSKTIPFSATMTIATLHREITKAFAVAADKQRLVYNGAELQTYRPNGSHYTVSECEIKPFSTIHLMILLYAIPETLNHVIFDLSWSYPAHGRDFLDATCHLFMTDVRFSYVDWRYKSDYGINYESAVWHSGDVMNNRKRTGHHIIEAKLKNIPLCVSHLVFTLSSFRAPSINHFPNPGLKFYNALDKDQDLCTTTFGHALHSTAVIICCVSRQQDGNWRIYDGVRLLLELHKTIHQWYLPSRH